MRGGKGQRAVGSDSILIDAFIAVHYHWIASINLIIDCNGRAA
jgi:hypothetical protein